MNNLKTTEGAYTSSGVNIHLADTLKSGLKQKVRKTLRREVLGAIGGFGGLFALDLKKHKRPVLVSSMDGVGTKLKIAVALNKHDTVGQDLVNHCVNDIAAVGAEPLFFLDYIGMGELSPRVFHQLIDGLVKACVAAGCALCLPLVFFAFVFDAVQLSEAATPELPSVSVSLQLRSTSLSCAIDQSA